MEGHQASFDESVRRIDKGCPQGGEESWHETSRCCGGGQRGSENEVRVVIDTNVLVSGVFFGGLPGRILEAWKEEDLTAEPRPEPRHEERVFDPTHAKISGR